MPQSEGAIISMCRMRRILNAEYKKDDLNKVMTKQCQLLSTKERQILIEILRRFEDISTAR